MSNRFPMSNVDYILLAGWIVLVTGVAIWASSNLLARAQPNSDLPVHSSVDAAPHETFAIVPAEVIDPSAENFVGPGNLSSGSWSK
jgi:hypothetical protein